MACHVVGACGNLLPVLMGGGWRVGCCVSVVGVVVRLSDMMHVGPGQQPGRQGSRIMSVCGCTWRRSVIVEIILGPDLLLLWASACKAWIRRCQT